MFIVVKSKRQGEMIINTDHIVRISAPKGESKGYYIFLNEMDSDEEGNRENYWFYAYEPSYTELKEKLCG